MVPSRADDPGAPPERVVAIDAAELSGLFSAPQWLRDLGLMTWLLVGIGAVLIGLVWLLGLTSSITVPVILGCIALAVAGPIVDKLERRRVPRAGGAAIVLLGLVAIGVLIVLMVLGGLASQSDEINAALNIGRLEDRERAQGRRRELERRGQVHQRRQERRAGRSARRSSRASPTGSAASRRCSSRSRSPSSAPSSCSRTARRCGAG